MIPKHTLVITITTLIMIIIMIIVVINIIMMIITIHIPKIVFLDVLLILLLR